MSGVWRLCYDVVRAIAVFAEKIVTIFTTPLGKVLEGADTGAPVLDDLLSLFGDILTAMGIGGVTLLEFMFASGVVVWVLIAVVKALIPN